MDRSRVEIEGAGKVGPLSSFSVTENASLIELGGSIPGIGGVSFMAGARKNSENAISERFTLSDPKMGSISGLIDDVSPAQSDVNVSAHSELSLLVAERTMNPASRRNMNFAGISALPTPDYIDGAQTWMTVDSSGNTYLAYPSTVNPARTVLLSKFGPNGDLLKSLYVSVQGTRSRLTAALGWDSLRSVLMLGISDRYYRFDGELNQLGDPVSYTGGYIEDIVYNRYTDRIVVASSVINTPANRALSSFTTDFTDAILLAGASTGHIYAVGPTTYDEMLVIFSVNPGSSQINGAMVQIDTGIAYFNIYARIAEANGSVPEVGPGRTICVRPRSTSEYLFDIIMIMNGAGGMRLVRISFATNNVNRPGIITEQVIVSANEVTTEPRRVAYDGVGNIRVLYGRQPGASVLNLRSYRLFATDTPVLSELFLQIAELVTTRLKVSYQASIDPAVPIVGWSGQVWGKLNELAVAYGLELAYDGSTLIVRDQMSVAIQLPHFDAPQRSISVGSAQKLEVGWNNAEFRYGVLYDAYEDDNKIISAEAGTTTTESVTLDSFPLYIYPPINVDTVTRQQGTYTITDTNGLLVPPAMFRDFGGKVSIRVDPERPNTILIDLQAPRFDIPSQPGPYGLDIRDGDENYARLSIMADAIFIKQETAILETGADPADVTTELVSTADSNVFIRSYEQARRASDWAVYLAGGPNVEISFSIGYRSMKGLGATAGATFFMGDRRFRITGASLSHTGCRITAVMMVTVGDFEDAWAGYTVGDFEDLWAGFKVKDFQLSPLRTEE